MITNARELPSQEELLSIFLYHPDGYLIRKSNISHKNNLIGKHSHNIVQVKVNNVKYCAHRIIYVMHHGDNIDNLQIEWVDGNTNNNRIENLRAVIPKVKPPRKLNHRDGLPLTEEHKRKISQANIGKKLTPEQCKKISESKRGIPRDEETRKKISQSKKGIPRPQEVIEKIMNTKREKKNDRVDCN